MRTSAVLVMQSAALVLLSAFASPSIAQTGTSDDWKFDYELYGWLPEIRGEAQSGSKFKLELSDLLDNLDFVFYSKVAARKRDWTFSADVIYMKLGDDNSATINKPIGRRGRSLNLQTNADVDLKAWVLNLQAANEVYRSDRVALSLLGGVRYLNLQVDLALSENADRFNAEESESLSSGAHWDGVVGARGEINVTSKWFVPYYVDGGTGDSKFTYQVASGLGYRFGWGEVIGTYRHMRWDFDDKDALKDLIVTGPQLGAVWHFD